MDQVLQGCNALQNLICAHSVFCSLLLLCHLIYLLLLCSHRCSSTILRCSPGEDRHCAWSIQESLVEDRDERSAVPDCCCSYSQTLHSNARARMANTFIHTDALETDRPYRDRVISSNSAAVFEGGYGCGLDAVGAYQQGQMCRARPTCMRYGMRRAAARPTAATHERHDAATFVAP